MKNNSTAAEGFTLVELSVVIAVIAVLVALLLPVLSAAKHKAQRTICLNNLRQINLGVRMYSDDSQDASPSLGWAGLTSTNIESAYYGYKELMKNYVGLNGASSPQDKLFQCPADIFNANWFFTDNPPWHFIQKSMHADSLFDYSSYTFNGGDNATRKIGKALITFPGLTGVKLSSVEHPARTLLVAEIPAIAPYSWHDPSSHGVASKNGNGTEYNDSKNVVSFVDGHVSYIRIYWNKRLAFDYDPPAGYDYQWSPY
jgi:prepilin-type N-terminal cleavage/methylation domain-containing protein